MNQQQIPELWWKWLLFAGVFLLVDALICFAFARLLVESSYDLIFGASAHQDVSANAITFMQAFVIMAGGMEGVAGTLVISIARYPFRKGELWAWWAILLATIPWYFFTVARSLLLINGEKWLLVIFGCAYYLVLFVPPLLFSKKYFLQGEK